MQAPVRWISGLRNHAHVLLIVPLVVIVMTWPTFAHVFDRDQFWLLSFFPDNFTRLWDAWHLERVLSGQSTYYYTDAWFHPQGASLTFHGTSTVGVVLLLLLQKLLPASNAYNLLFLLILGFNAFSAYVLLFHLFDDKWIALFGAVVVGVSLPQPSGSATPDLIMIGTLPLTIYFLRRALLEDRWRFAALAGFCAGLTVFIGVYIYVFILLTIGIYSAFLAVTRWKRLNFWRHLLLFLVLCGAIGFLRFYPMLADRITLEEGLERFLDDQDGNDVLDHFVLDGNPFTSGFLRSVFAVDPDTRLRNAYFGYINLFFLACALFPKPRWRRLLPWLAIMAFFAIMRLGNILTIDGLSYPDILLPKHFLSKSFPALFGQIHKERYYQIGVIVPLAVVACIGLGRLIQSRPPMVRALVALLCSLIVMLEFHTTRTGWTLEPDKTVYIDWLRSETDSVGALINLPLWRSNPGYFLYLQTLTQKPSMFGYAYRNPESAKTYVRSNLLLHNWDRNRKVYCLDHNQRDFLSALEQLVADGATHVVVHNWLHGDQFINHSFWNVPPAYDDGYVSVYRLSDMRKSCQRLPNALPQFRHLADSAAIHSGYESSILSFHPSETIGKDSFAYLASLFSEWKSLLHLNFEDGQLVTQSAGKSYADLTAFARDNHVIYLAYNRFEGDAASLPAKSALETLTLCQRDEHEDGSVIELFLSRDLSCALAASVEPIRVHYDNRTRLEIAVLEIEEDQVDVQFLWSNLPREPHSVSLQVFDAEGAKVLGQDSTIGHVSLARHRVDISSLPPGEYQVKLIVYNYVTGRSVTGSVSETGERFERELTITTLDRR